MGRSNTKGTRTKAAPFKFAKAGSTNLHSVFVDSSGADFAFEAVRIDCRGYR